MSTTKGITWEETGSIIQMKKFDKAITENECVTTTVTNDLNGNEPSTFTIKTKISGIYKIVNKINGKYYVGSSSDVFYRINYRHVKLLMENRHINSHLQNAWNKYGKNNFDFILVEEVSKPKLLQTEQKYLDLAKNQNDSYNLSFDATAPMLGRKHSPISIQKLKDRWKYFPHPMKGKFHSKESKMKMSLSCRDMRGNKNPMYGKIGGHKGKLHSTNSKKKMSDNNCKFWLGKKMSEITKEKMRVSHLGTKNSWFGKHHTDKTKQKLSLAHRDKTIYDFKNKNTNVVFTGISYDFSKQFNLIPLSVRKLVQGKMKTLYNWQCQPSMKTRCH